MTSNEKIRTVELAPDLDVWLLHASGGDTQGIAMLLSKIGLRTTKTLIDETKLMSELTSSRPAILVLDAHVQGEVGTRIIKDVRALSDVPNFPVLPIFTAAQWQSFKEVLALYDVCNAALFPLNAQGFADALINALHRFEKSAAEQFISKARKAFGSSNWAESETYYRAAGEKGAVLRSEVGLCDTSLRQGDFERSKAHSAKVVQLDPDNFQAQIASLNARAKEKSMSAAEIVAVASTMLLASPPQARLVQIIKACAPEPKAVIEIFGKNQSLFSQLNGCVVEVGKAHYTTGNVDEAHKLCMRAYKAGFRSLELLNLLGVMSKSSGNLELAIRYYSEALSVSALDYRVLFNLGICYEDAGLKDQARDSYQKCVKVAPQFTKALERLGRLA